MSISFLPKTLSSIFDLHKLIIELHCHSRNSNCLGASSEIDGFGKALIKSALSTKTIAEWCVDPRVTLPGGEKGSVFDALEDMDVDDCLAKLVELNAINTSTY